MNIDDQVELLMQGTEYGDDELRNAMARELRERLALCQAEGRSLRVNCGYDPTSADLHVGLLGHSIVSLHERVERLMEVDGLLPGQSQGEVLTSKELLDREILTEADQVEQCQLAEPFAIVADYGLPRIQHTEGLLRVGLGVFRHFLLGQQRTRLVLV